MTSVLSITVGSVTLSNGGLTAKATANSSWAACADQVLLGRSGLYYFEGVFNAVTVANYWTAIGIGSPASGDNNNYECCFASGSNGQINQPGTTVITMGSVPIVSGDNVSVALDATNNLIWFRKNGGLWNNSGTATPSTSTSSPGIGGVALNTTALTTSVTPACNLSTVNDQVTFNFGGSAYAYAPPTGYADWPQLGLALVTQTALEVFYAGNPDLRVTQTALEVFYAGNPDLRVTQTALEVWRLTVDPPASINVTASRTLGAVTSTAAAQHADNLQGSPTLGPVTVSALGHTSDSAGANTTLAPFGVAATVKVVDDLIFNASLDALTTSIVVHETPLGWGASALLVGI